MNASVKGGGSVFKHWLEWLKELLQSGWLTQAELRIIRAVIKAFHQKVPNGGQPKIKGMLTAEHSIALRAIANRHASSPEVSNALNKAADEVEDKLK
jgi:hypothetical protein